MSEIIWSALDPLGNEVILKKDTYDYHICGEPKRSEEEVSNLRAVLGDTKKLIEKPRFIYKDINHIQNRRVRYLDTIYLEDLGAIRALVAVVDTDRTPYEVVTYMIKRDLKQENPTKDMIIYDSRAY